MMGSLLMVRWWGEAGLRQFQSAVGVAQHVAQTFHAQVEAAQFLRERREGMGCAVSPPLPVGSGERTTGSSRVVKAWRWSPGCR